MTTSMTDVLITLSDPILLREFCRDPAHFLADKGLTEDERAALLSRNDLQISRHARTRLAEHQPAGGSSQDAMLCLDVHVHLHLTHNAMVTVEDPGVLFMDGEGLLYRGIHEAGSANQ